MEKSCSSKRRGGVRVFIRLVVMAAWMFMMNMSVVGAVSGACSYHGGVDCSAGPDTDGSVICMDGWTESMVTFISMDKCVYSAPGDTDITPVTTQPAPATDNSSDHIPALDAEVWSFSDVHGGTLYHSSIETLKEKKIISGYPDGTFRPTQVLKRAELLKIVIGAKYPSIDEKYDQKCFNDVEKGQWYTKPICFGKAYGFISGYADNTFKPEQEVNYVEGLKMALEVFKMKPSETTEVWYEAYLNVSRMKGIDIEGSVPSEGLSRAKAAEMMVRVMGE